MWTEDRSASPDHTPYSKRDVGTLAHAYGMSEVTSIENIFVFARLADAMVVVVLCGVL